MASLAQATAVRQTSSHTYTAHFPDNFCIGSVPHGGYVTSCFQQVAKKHFASTLSKQNQPHTMTMHLEFLRRTNVGEAHFTVKDVKLGRQTSTIHVTLSQGSREEVLAYITQSNLTAESGISFETGWKLDPPPPAADVTALKANKDSNWQEQKSMPFVLFRKASANVDFFFPRKGQLVRSLGDQWMRMANGEKWMSTDLGFIADMFPQIIEAYRTGTDPYSVAADNKASEEEAKKKGMAPFWYPTLLLNLDVKKALPEEGVEFLFVRARAKQIKNGRFDLEIVILDEGGDVVALSHHVCMVLSAERNLAKRDNKQDAQGSKL